MIAKQAFDRDGRAVIFEADGVTVTAFSVDHRPVEPAVGYRLDYRGRSVVISGDTLPAESLVRQAQGVDLLAHEAMNPAMLATLNRAATVNDGFVTAHVADDILSHHTLPEEAARIVRDADAGHLVLTHLIPPMPASVLHPLFLRDSERLFAEPVAIGYDGMLFSLLPDSTAIHDQWLLK